VIGVTEKMSKFQNGLLDGAITPSDYKEMKHKIEKVLRNTQERLDRLANRITYYKNYITKEQPMLDELAM
jgi:prefoldin subunit 5